MTMRDAAPPPAAAPAFSAGSSRAVSVKCARWFTASVSSQLSTVSTRRRLNTPAQFTAFQAAESARWKHVIEVGHITAD